MGRSSRSIHEFIDIGVDALNPVQVSSVGMDTAALKAELATASASGAAIDTGRVLPAGTSEDVRARGSVAHPATWLPAAALCWLPVHNIQEDVPPENIVAMVDAAINYQSSGLRLSTR